MSDYDKFFEILEDIRQSILDSVNSGASLNWSISMSNEIKEIQNNIKQGGF